MSEHAAKDALWALLQEAISKMRSESIPLDRLRGIAFFSTERDALLISLSSFDTASRTVTKIPNFSLRFGSEAAARVVLQFAYQYFQRIESIEYQQAVLEDLWFDLVSEIEDSHWVIRGVANVRNFDSGSNLIDLGDGVTIRGRSPTDLASLGFGDAVWERVTEDWHGPGASSFVLVTEHSFEKQPDNLVLLDCYAVSVKAMRAVQALRLAAAGSISVGPMWVVRPAHFNVGMGGLTSMGASIPGFGSRYRWTEEIEQAYPSIYAALTAFEQTGCVECPGNLAIGLQAFMATYDRWPTSQGSQLLDSITALEGLLGTETEITFRLSFRAACLLAKNDRERGLIFTLMRSFYDTRSKLVHGRSLKQKQHDLLQRVDELRCIVRRLLRSFLAFSVTTPKAYGKEFWDQQLDGALLDSEEREKLRATLGLS